MTRKNLQNSEDHPVILVIGQTGVGKSVFINQALGKDEAHVGHTYDDGTKDVQRFLCEDGEPPVYLVDTPGLDDAYLDDRAVMEKILNWLEANVCKPDNEKKAQFGGILYLVAAGQNKLPMHDKFQKSPALKDHLVVVGTKASESAKFKTEVDCQINEKTGREEAREAVKAILEKGQVISAADLQALIQIWRKELGSTTAKDNKSHKWFRDGFFSYLFRRF